jgi:hypothetical protein
MPGRDVRLRIQRQSKFWRWELTTRRLLDGQPTFREQLEWLEKAETLMVRLRANRQAISNHKTPLMRGEMSELEKLQREQSAP